MNQYLIKIKDSNVKNTWEITKIMRIWRNKY